MPKELYIYTSIYNDSAKEFISALDDAGDEDVTIRVNTPGGSVFAFWGMAAKMSEMTGKKTIKVDGMAASAGAFFLLYGDTVEVLDVSTIMLHRADMYISSPEDQAFLDRVNADLKKKMSKKIDSNKLKEISGYTIDDLFNPETRLDLFLTAKQAKAIGLVDKITKVNPSELKAFNERYFGIAASAEPTTNKNSNTKINKTMDLITLKAEHPALYNEIFNAGLKAGTEAEKDRVEAALVFNEIDPKGVKAAIESGKPLTAKQMAEFSLKQMNPEYLKKLSAESADATATTAVDTKQTDEEKRLAAIEAELDENLGLNKEKK